MKKPPPLKIGEKVKTGPFKGMTKVRVMLLGQVGEVEREGLVFKPTDQLAVTPALSGPLGMWNITHRKSGYHVGSYDGPHTDKQARLKMKQLLPLADWDAVFKIAYGRGGKP